MRGPVCLLVFGLLIGCAGDGVVRSLDPLPRGGTTTLERTDDGKPVLLVRQGTLPELRGEALQLPPGEATFLVFHDGEGSEPEEGEEPARATLWIRGRGARRHTLPSAVSPAVEPGASDDWTVDLPPGTYDLSVTLGARGDEPPVPVFVR
jgi:hypothetical protein